MDKYRLNLSITLKDVRGEDLNLPKGFKTLNQAVADALYGIKPKEAIRTRMLAEEIYKNEYIDKNLPDLNYLEKEIKKIEWKGFECLIKSEIEGAFLKAKRVSVAKIKKDNEE